ncbi:MAG: ATP phosphoribosyltransferase regulatory subunit [Candidatus Puniceispirillaceae bacterium]
MSFDKKSPEDMPSALLPAGLQDVLYPQAQNDAKASEIIMDCLAAFGYQRVQPPLVEFEDSLLGDKLGAALSDKTFRLLDPLSHKMMALRADMTAQIARISGSRLSHMPRPLRLSYCGSVMRVVPDVLNPERQMVQAGAELIGSNDALASAEMVSLGVRALNLAGISGLTVDMGVPHLFDLITADCEADLQSDMADALRLRDSDALLALGHPAATLLSDLLRVSGQDVEPVKTLMPQLSKDAAVMVDTVLHVQSVVKSIWPDLPITLDLLDRRDGDYHKGLHFAIFSEGLRGEIARGGSYQTGYGEEATGLSIYMERVLRALPAAPKQASIYVAATAGLGTAMALAERGRSVIMGSEGVDPKKQAREMGCEFIILQADDMPQALED